MLSATLPLNRLALTSSLLAGLTFISFCLGAVPIPMTAWLCYPATLLFGSAALVTGFGALRQLRVNREKGRQLALIGVWSGVLAVLAVFCFTALTIGVYFAGAEVIRDLWPYFNP